MFALASFVCGIIFGIGLLISDMTQPTRVLGFLGHRRPMGPHLGFCHGRRTLCLGHRLCAAAAAGPALASHKASVANSHRYRFIARRRIDFVRRRLGPGGALSRTSTSEPRGSDAKCDGVRTSDGRRDDH